MAAVLGLAWGGVALAQVPGGQPAPLGPQPGHSDGAEPGPTPTLLKVVPSPAAEPAHAKPAEAAKDHRFQVEELKAPDPEAVGVLDERQGGLAVTLWKGAQAKVVRHFLPQIPAAPSSRTMRGLARRLLLSAAVPPEGGKGQSPSLLELRAERLYAMGEVEGLASLLKAAPASMGSPALARLKAEGQLLAGDGAGACGGGAAQAGGADQRFQIFCMLTGGKVLEANMALDLMRERKDADQVFIAAAEAMGGTPPGKVDKLPNPQPLHLAAFRAAKMPLPADVATGVPPATLRALVDAPGLAPEARVPAAEKAEAMGLIDADALRKVYAGVTFTPAEQQAAMGQADRTPRARVLLLRAAQQEQAPAVKAELIARILAAAAERGAFSATARLYAPVIAEVKPAPDLAPQALSLARALFAAGRPEAAGNWLALAKGDGTQAKAADELWLLGRLYRPGEAAAADGDGRSGWMVARELSPADQAERRLAVGLELLQALGDKVPAADWLALPKGGAGGSAGPSPALRALLRGAAEGGHQGEVVLLSLVALGEGGLETVEPDLLNRVVAALKSVGLEREARDLAIEAALANGN